jgi:hypothetical protein
MDLQHELVAMAPEYDLDELAAEFIEVAVNYGERASAMSNGARQVCGPRW